MLNSAARLRVCPARHLTRSTILSQVPSSWAAIQRPELPHLLERIEAKIWQKVQEQCAILHTHLDSLSDVAVSMKMEVSALHELSLTPVIGKEPPKDPESDMSNPDESAALFLLTSLPGLVARIDRLVACYVQELELKVGMAVDLTRTRDRKTLTAYLSAWTVQVFVDDEDLQALTDQIETEAVLSKTEAVVQ